MLHHSDNETESESFIDYAKLEAAPKDYEMMGKSLEISRTFDQGVPNKTRSLDNAFYIEEADPRHLLGGPSPAEKRQDHLARKLTARQIQMIAIGGTIGTGLFLGTGKTLSTGGPASMLLSYLIIGFIVYNTMLCLGEMATYMPIAGTFTTYASRFIDEGFGFALTWNYWFNDAVSVAGDLVAAQVILSFWTSALSARAERTVGWLVTVVLWILIVGVNGLGVGWYGEIEYGLSLLKVVTIILFIIIGIIINCGGNVDHEYIGFRNWSAAPFVGGIGGFASVFVTAAFAFGGTESIGVTAGETRDPRKNMPRVIKNVFWRVLIFYVLATFVIGLNVPHDTPGLADGDVKDSPFTLVFSLTGLSWAAHFINAVIISSVISAGNHALFAGTRLLFAMSREGQAPKMFGKVTPNRKVPLPAMCLTAAVSCVCFASSFVGHGVLWGWLQALVGVSNQIAWVSIGWSNWRFRKALTAQGIQPQNALPFRNPLYPFSPIFVVITNVCLVLVQGWKSLVPKDENGNYQKGGKFDWPTFLSYYIEIPFLFVMWLIWKLKHKTVILPYHLIDLATDRYAGFDDDDSLAAGNTQHAGSRVGGSGNALAGRGIAGSGLAGNGLGGSEEGPVVELGSPARSSTLQRRRGESADLRLNTELDSEQRNKFRRVKNIFVNVL